MSELSLLPKAVHGVRVFKYAGGISPGFSASVDRLRTTRGFKRKIPVTLNTAFIISIV